MARSRNHRFIKRKARKTYSVIVDGRTEVWYLQMLKKNEDLPRIDVKPELPKKKKLSEQYISVIDNSKIYDEVIWIVDFDTILKETKENKSGTKPALLEFREYKNEIDKNHPNVEVLINTPCLELWLLLHFEEIGKVFPNCDSAEKQLRRKHIKNYEKSEKFYKKRHNDIYKLLRNKRDLAIENAQKLGNFDFNKANNSVAEIYKIFKKFGLKK